LRTILSGCGVNFKLTFRNTTIQRSIIVRYFLLEDKITKSSA